MGAGGRLMRLARILPDHARTAWWGLVGHRRQALRVVQAVVLREGRVLLTVRSDLHGWELPGGNPKAGESERDTLLREVREETGLEVEIERLVGDYHRTGFLPHLARVYRCRPRAGVVRPSSETPRVRWWPIDALPETLFPWYRAPLRDALAEDAPAVSRHEHQGLAAVWAGLVTDLRMRWTDDRAT